MSSHAVQVVPFVRVDLRRKIVCVKIDKVVVVLNAWDLERKNTV